MDLQQIVAEVGTPFGIWLGQRLGAKAEGRRWLREWQVGQIQERRSYAAEACTALDAQILLYQTRCRAEQRTGPAVSSDRVIETTRMWRSVLGGRYVYADASLQLALSQFDSALAVGTEAINEHDDHRMTEAAEMLDQARFAAMDSVQIFLDVVQQALATYTSAVPPWWNVQHWRLKPSQLH
jgi:hypothetical protein